MNANARVALAALCLVSALVSCSSGGGTGGDGSGGGDGPATPVSIVVAAGDGQSAPGSTRLPRAPDVVVFAADGGPAVGITVEFAIVSGGGSVDAATATTDESGHASTGWTVGPAPGLNHLRASVPGLAPVSFFAKAVNTSPDVTLEVTEPRDGQLVTEDLTVAAGVSSTYQLATVTASVDGHSVGLSYSYTRWTGMLSLAGKARGLIVLVVTATDVFGHASEAVVPLILDRPPVVTVSAPLDKSVVRAPTSIVATCTDDDSTGCSSITASVNGTVVSSGKESLSEPVDFAAFEGQAVTLEIAGIDSAGQRTTVSRDLFVESSGHLSVRAVLGGPPCDVSGTRILFVDRSGSTQVMKVLDRDSGTTLSLDTASYIPCDAFLTSRGAIYRMYQTTGSWLREWRDGITTTLEQLDSYTPIRVAGDWAIYITDGPHYLMLRDLLAGTSTFLLDDYYVEGGPKFYWLNVHDVAANGDVVHTGHYGVIYRWRDGVSERLGSGYRPVTDGVNVVYLGSSGNPEFPYNLVVHDGVTTSTIAQRVHGVGHAVAAGYIAYAAEDATRVPQIWRYRAGESEQLSFFGSSSTLDVVAPDGTVLFTSGGRRYRAVPGAPLEDIGSSLGTVVLRDGRFFVLLGYTVLEIGP